MNSTFLNRNHMTCWESCIPVARMQSICILVDLFLFRTAQQILNSTHPQFFSKKQAWILIHLHRDDSFQLKGTDYGHLSEAQNRLLTVQSLFLWRRQRLHVNACNSTSTELHLSPLQSNVSPAFQMKPVRRTFPVVVAETMTPHQHPAIVSAKNSFSTSTISQFSPSVQLKHVLLSQG